MIESSIDNKFVTIKIQNTKLINYYILYTHIICIYVNVDILYAVYYVYVCAVCNVRGVSGELDNIYTDPQNV